jgi:GAF domain-containing protein/HAMP domain-containing protein
MNINRFPTLRSRLAFVLIVLAALFAAAVSYVLYVNFRNELREGLRHRLANIASLAGLQQDGDTFIKVQAQSDEYFRRIHATNLKIKLTDPDLIFVYTMRKDEKGIYFVVDAGLPGEPDISAYGDIYEKPSQTLLVNFDNMPGTIVEPEIYQDEFGAFLSAYTPIFTSAGQKVGVLGVDISAGTILAQERAFRLRLMIIYLVILPFIFLAGIIAANYLARPIVQLRDAANKISSGDLSYRIPTLPGTRELAELAVDFNAMTANLSSLITDLERRVLERTEDITRKTDQLRAASYIAHQTAEIQELSLLLNLVVRLVSDQFGFYHTGIYLINETGDEVVLQAASSEGGRQMVEKHHAIKVGTQTIVGYVTGQRKPRIALDVGADAITFNNPSLPMTRSEIALPLLVRGKLLGVLDIHSDKPEAFSFKDMDVLETLADQMAVAIDNARLLDESQAAFQQLEALTAIRTREAWSQKLGKSQRAFTYTPLGLLAGKPSTNDENAIKIPITLRGQKIGSISLARRNYEHWNKLDEELMVEVATQAGLAVDNIRLLEEATERAKQEQVVGELAFRFSQALDIDSLLQTATRELAQLPGVEEATVFIGAPDNTPEADEGDYRRAKPLRRTRS